MSHLYQNLRLHQVFGANTDVGKTIFTTALCLASASLPIPSNSSLRDAKSSLEEHERNVREAIQGQGGSRRGERVHYLKPVSTGPMEDSDDR
jgi:dethiobiotin synthetase/adenosylmethionine--8-amino-7-oxononanoate aminotransferase